MSADMLHALQPLQQLTHLNVMTSHNSLFPLLEELQVHPASTLTDTHFAALTATLAQTQIHTLVLDDTQHLTDAIWPHVARLTRLRKLILTSSA